MKNKSLLMLFMLLVSHFVFSQKNKTNDIDLYLKEAKKYSESFENIKLLRSAKKANILALKEDNAEQIANSYYLMSLALYNLRTTNESLTAAEKGLHVKSVNNKILKARLHDLKAMNYGLLDLYTQSLAECDKVIEILAGLEANVDAAVIISNAYQNIGIAYYLKSNNSLDSIKKYSKKSFAILKGKPIEKTFTALSVAYLNEGYNQLESKNLDSTKYYFDEISKLKKQYKEKHFYDINYAWGKYYSEKKEYSTALKYYLDAVEEIKSSGFKNSGLINFENIYLNISETYGLLGDSKKEKKYLNIYIQETKNVAYNHKKAIANALEIIKEEDKEAAINIHRKRLSLIGVISLFFAIILLSYYQLYKRKSRKLLFEKEEEILKNEEENQELKQKVNESFNEVIQLAKSNSPEFLTRFQEIYPEIQEKILAVNSDVSVSELKIAAYIYLGFTIKEIADYTFRSDRTVERVRYTLRKKIGLDRKDSLDLWLKN